MQLLRSLVLRDLKTRYFTSLGGFAWALLLPLFQLGIYAFVFTQILPVRFPNQDQSGFVPYLALGLWPWLAVSESVTRAATAISDNEALIGKVALPHQVLVQSSVCATFLLHGLGLLVVIAVLGLTGVPFHWLGLHGLVFTMLAGFILAMGLAYLVSATQVFVPDLTHALGPLFTIWFFTTPILYPESLVPERFRSLLAFNPMAAVLRPIREALLEGRHGYPLETLVMLVGVVLLALLGHWYFNRLSRHFEDFL